MDIVRYKNEEDTSINRAVELVLQSGGIEYAHEKMMEYGKKAIELLTEIPESDAKKSLIGLVHFTMNREK